MRMSDEDWQLVLDVNLSAGFKLAKAAIRGMMKRRYGRIIGIASVVGVMGNPGQANYSASKAGMIAMNKCLAQEVGSRGVTVNSIAPGFIRTPMTDVLPDDVKAQLLSKIPEGKLGEAQDIANAVAFLASDEAQYITGQTLHVNGAIRGGGTNGEVTLKGDNGYVTIGATSQAMEFNTNKSKFVLNKPIYSYNGIFASSDSVDLYFKTNHNTRMTILESNGNVGVGTTIPQGRLHVDKGHLRIGNGTSESSRSANVLLFGDNTHVQIGEWQADNMLSFQANTYNFTTGNVGIGTTSPSYKLDVNGTIRANEIIVNTTGADFVFADDYQLRPLSEVKAFIQENKHLPEIQSAKEMQENGVGINELQTQLLQKIEELTLYLIQQEQIIEELRHVVELLMK